MLRSFHTLCSFYYPRRAPQFATSSTISRKRRAPSREANQDGGKFTEDRLLHKLVAVSDSLEAVTARIAKCPAIVHERGANGDYPIHRACINKTPAAHSIMRAVIDVAPEVPSCIVYIYCTCDMPRAVGECSWPGQCTTTSHFLLKHT